MQITKFNHIIIANVKVMAYTVPNEMTGVEMAAIQLEVEESMRCCSVIFDANTRSVLVMHNSVEQFEGICQSLGYEVVQR